MGEIEKEEKAPREKREHVERNGRVEVCHIWHIISVARA